MFYIGEFRANLVLVYRFCEVLSYKKWTLIGGFTIEIETKLASFLHTVPGHKSWTASCFLKQNYPKYRLCERDMGGSYLL